MSFPPRSVHTADGGVTPAARRPISGAWSIVALTDALAYAAPVPLRELPAVGGLEVGAVLATLAAHATPGSEAVDPDGHYRRLLEVSGTPVPVSLAIHQGGVRLRAPVGALQEVAGLVRWWFDLDTDPRPVVDRLGRDPLLLPLVRERPALRPLRHPAGFEATVDTVLGQQVTLASARLFGHRLRTAYSPGLVDGLVPFPSARVLAGAPLEELRAAVGLTTARARTVRAVARLFADGFTLGPATDPVAARHELLAVPGIGPWTVEYLALRVLGDPDAFPASDAVVRRALGGAAAREAEALAEAWRPHRSWATAHLWAGQTST